MPRADLEPLHQAELLELLERPVDAGPADRGLAAAQLVVELERGDRAVVAGERLDHRGAGAAAPVAGRLQRRQRVLGPGSCRSSSPSPDRSLGRRRGPESRAEQAARRQREQVGGDDRQRDRGAAGGARVVGEVEAGEAGEHRDRGRERDHRRDPVAELARGGRRADEDGDDEQVAEALDGDDDRQRQQDQQRRVGDARARRPGTRAAPRSKPAASRRPCSSQSAARDDERPGAAAASRSASVGPRMSPKSSASIPGGESGESASRTPSPNIVVTTTATATSRLTPGTRRDERDRQRGDDDRRAPPPSSSGTPAIAARTRPGKIEWASDSAA